MDRRPRRQDHLPAVRVPQRGGAPETQVSITNSLRGKSNVDSADCSGATARPRASSNSTLMMMITRCKTMNALTQTANSFRIDVVPITDSSECPPASTLAQVLGDDKRCDNVLCGELCEGDGECGTTNSLDSVELRRLPHGVAKSSTSPSTATASRRSSALRTAGLVTKQTRKSR